MGEGAKDGESGDRQESNSGLSAASWRKGGGSRGSRALSALRPPDSACTCVWSVGCLQSLAGNLTLPPIILLLLLTRALIPSGPPGSGFGCFESPHAPPTPTQGHFPGSCCHISSQISSVQKTMLDMTVDGRVASELAFQVWTEAEAADDSSDALHTGALPGGTAHSEQSWTPCPWSFGLNPSLSFSCVPPGIEALTAKAAWLVEMFPLRRMLSPSGWWRSLCGA